MEAARDALAAASRIIDSAAAHLPVTRHPEAWRAAALAEATKQLRAAVAALERLQDVSQSAGGGAGGITGRVGAGGRCSGR